MVPESGTVRVLFNNSFAGFLAGFAFVADRPFHAAFHEYVTGSLLAIKAFFATGIDKLFHLTLPPFRFFAKVFDSLFGFVRIEFTEGFFIDSHYGR